jgi:fructokinase
MQKTLVAFGELLWDLLPSGMALGGAPSNFAFRVNSLGDIGTIISRVGRDPLGKEAIGKLKELGMDTTRIQLDDQHPTGTVQVRVDKSGAPDFSIAPDVAYDYIEATDELLSLVWPVDCFCFGTLAQRAPASRATLRELLDASPDALKLLDLNLRKQCYSPETVAGSLKRADVLKLNEQEAGYVAAQFQLSANSIPIIAEEILLRWELSHCLITLEERGAYAVARDGHRVYSPGYKVPLVDTCGSGDAFTAGFAHCLLHGEPLPKCLQIGNALGALVATQAGATEYLSQEDVEAFLNSSPEKIYDDALRPLEAG